MSDTLTIATIIHEAGGAAAIERSAHLAGVSLSSDAVYKWRKTGIPDRHWPLILSLTPFKVDDLFRANCQARNVPERLLGSAAE